MMTRLQSRKLRENSSRPNIGYKAKSVVAIFEDKTSDVVNAENYSRRSFPLEHDSGGCHKIRKPASKTDSHAKQGLSLRHRNRDQKVNYETLFTGHPAQKTPHATEVHMESSSRDDCTSPVAMETESNNSLENTLTKTVVPDDVIDIDACPDSLSTNVYSKDIMDYLMEKESRERLLPGFLDNCPGVTSSMRAVLMDWLLQVQVYEELKDETLHLCVTLIDTYLSLADVQMSTLQLIGITCLFIASKFHERFAPKVDSLCYLTQNTFTKEQVLDLEFPLLHALHFNLARPVSVTFLDRFLQVHHNPPKVEHLARYLLDLSITSIALASLPPSIRASSALYLARLLVLDTPVVWTPELTFYTNYTVEDLQDCTNTLINLLVKAPYSRHQGARLKYSKEEYLCISHCDQVQAEWMVSKKYT
ncbi:hypothetical protein BsWGS_15478 [Bradybaena similaris]